MVQLRKRTIESARSTIPSPVEAPLAAADSFDAAETTDGGPPSDFDEEPTVPGPAALAARAAARAAQRDLPRA